MTTIVITCKRCHDHPFQDKTYGDKKRVANTGKQGARCTVCGTLHDVGIPKPKTETEEYGE